VTFRALWRRFFGVMWRTYRLPMTSDSRAVSTTSLVIVRSRLISSTRAIWLNSRCTNRKLPPVIRAIAASASASVQSSGEKVSPTSCHLWARMKRSSSSLRGRK